MTSTHADVSALDGVIDSLFAEFSGVFARATIAGVVADSALRLAPARLKAYQPLLAYRYARERLQDSAASAGAVPRREPVVLFVCIHNSGRSQMAAALLQHQAGDQVVVRSAGTAPVAELQPEVVDALAELGVDTAGAFPKPLAPETVEAADVVITMGCGDARPVLPGRRYLDWDLPDPADAEPDEVRRIRDDIADRVAGLLADLLHSPEGDAALDSGLLRLLADPLRARVVELLSTETLCTSHLVEMTGAKQTNISNHLKALRDAGLVTTEPCGRFTYNALAPQPLRDLAEQLGRLADAVDAGTPRRACP